MRLFRYEDATNVTGLWWSTPAYTACECVTAVSPDTWIRALTQPTEENYMEITSDAGPGSDSKAYTWIFLSSIISGLISVIISFILPPPSFNGISLGRPGFAAILISVICVPIIGILIFAVVVAIIQVVARALGGTGTYSQLLYTSAAFS